VRPSKDKRGVDLISDALPFACGTASQTQSATQSDMPNSTAAHIAPWFALRCSRQRDRNARARERVQRMVWFWRCAA